MRSGVDVSSEELANSLREIGISFEEIHKSGREIPISLRACYELSGRF